MHQSESADVRSGCENGGVDHAPPGCIPDGEGGVPVGLGSPRRARIGFELDAAVVAAGSAVGVGMVLNFLSARLRFAGYQSMASAGTMRFTLWCSAILLSYTYVGYPCWLWLRARWGRVSVRTSEIFPQVSILLIARNEAERLSRKLQNLTSLQYPPDCVEIIIVSDGSTDGTVSVARGWARPDIKTVELPSHRGKAAAINAGIARASGGIVVFSDVRQRIEANALCALTANFADPTVGCVTGELMLEHVADMQQGSGIGLYWRIEKLVRRLESETGSVVGATGALYAVRRRLVPAIPDTTLLDDLYIPMHVVREGARVIFEPRACAYDEPSSNPTREFRRKLRTLAGNYQLLVLAPWLLSPQNPVLFEFVSHKLLRLMAPFALLAALVATALADGRTYHILFLIQIGFYALAGVAGLLRRPPALARAADAAHAFTLLNTAAVMAFFMFVVRKGKVGDLWCDEGRSGKVARGATEDAEVPR